MPPRDASKEVALRCFLLRFLSVSSLLGTYFSAVLASFFEETWSRRRATNGGRDTGEGGRGRGEATREGTRQRREGLLAETGTRSQIIGYALKENVKLLRRFSVSER